MKINVFYVTVAAKPLTQPLVSPEFAEHVETRPGVRVDMGKFFTAEDADAHCAAMKVGGFHSAQVDARLEEDTDQHPAHQQKADVNPDWSLIEVEVDTTPSVR